MSHNKKKDVFQKLGRVLNLNGWLKMSVLIKFTQVYIT